MIDEDEEDFDFELTKRQTEVLNLICKFGYSNKMIASILEISICTVKAHVSAILSKSGLHSRSELIIFIQTTQEVK